MVHIVVVILTSILFFLLLHFALLPELCNREFCPFMTYFVFQLQATQTQTWTAFTCWLLVRHGALVTLITSWSQHS